jgi:heterodisulfide reductase subunit C
MKQKDSNPNVIEEVQSILRLCYQCGICTSGCPISEFTDAFKPNRLGRLLFLKVREKIPDEVLWTCLLCHACDEVCPQQIHFTDALLKLRNVKAHDGCAPKGVVKGIQLLAEEGRKVKVTNRTQLARERIGLNKIVKPPISEIRKILKATGFKFKEKR